MAATKLRPTFAFRKRLEFLASGKLHLKDSVNTITFSYTTSDKSCIGLRQFISKELPPIQYKNPEVQMVLFKNAHHYKFPAVKIYYRNGRCVMLDVEGKQPDAILAELTAIAGKTEEQMLKAQRALEYNPSHFGDARRGRLCICEIPGQVPCPAKIPIKNVHHPWHKKPES